MSLISLARRGRVIAVLAGALLLVPIVAEARPGGSHQRPRATRNLVALSAPQCAK